MTGLGYKQSFMQALKESDVFIWSGATGLSDYPNASLDIVSKAQKLGVKTVVFCTGMNDSLNPAHFKLNKGKKHALLNAASSLSGNTVDFVQRYEQKKEQQLRKHLKVVLDKCDLVVNRDLQSRQQLMKSYLTDLPLVAADPAITLSLKQPSNELWGSELVTFLDTDKKLLGVCISSQQELVEQKQFSSWLDHTIATKNVRIVFIPMNPITDFETMSTIRNDMTHRHETIIAKGSTLPESVAGLASKMDAIISSRLHLLIFASISATPCIGIGRGSKVSNFLSEFGMCTAGNTQAIEFEHLEKELSKIFNEKPMFVAIAKTVHANMLQRLQMGIKALETVLNPSAQALKEPSRSALSLQH
jgi:polysaccharide pyruvyl transferase WcaK-like protein